MRILEGEETSDATGIVYIVGAGPGDPGLITARGRDLIATADAIVYDSAVQRRLIPADARESGRPVLFFVGRRRSGRRIAADEISELLVRLARDGQRVVRLTGGDPFVFGPGPDEAQALYDASIPFEVVPGITAGIAALSYAGIPVTHSTMGSAVTFVTGSEIPGRADTRTDWSALAKSGGTIVVYTARRSIAAIAAALLEAGMPEEMPAAAVERGTRRAQRTVTATLSTLADALRRASFSGATTLIIGWPVILRDEMSWFEQRALFGKRIVVADASHVAGDAAARLRELGATVMQIPAESIARLDLASMRTAIEELPAYGWIVLTSRNAVTVFWEQLLGSGRDARSLAGILIAAAGAETAGKLLEHGITVDVLPDSFSAEVLLEAMRERDDVAGSRVLVIGPETQHIALASEIAEMGAEVTAVDAYRSVLDDRVARKLRRAIERKAIDIVVFTTVPSVGAFVAAAGPDLAANVRAGSIGDAVSDALREAGIEVTCEAAKPTAASLAATVEQALK
jgi:uroporphyrinogen III methyltransferase/synthase